MDWRSHRDCGDLRRAGRDGATAADGGGRAAADRTAGRRARPWSRTRARRHAGCRTVGSRSGPRRPHPRDGVKGLDHPWGIAFLPDGGISSPNGRDACASSATACSIRRRSVRCRRWWRAGLGGLLDVSLHPQFATNHLIYLAYSKPRRRSRQRDDRGLSRALGRRRDARRRQGHLRRRRRSKRRRISPSDPRAAASARASRGTKTVCSTSRSASATFPTTAQEPGSHLGKIVRLKDDGSVPKDNPFVGKAGYLPEIYTLGHRNPLGLYINPVTSDLWSTEEGPQGGDELNVIKAGKNYGWPRVSLGRNYDGTIVGEGFTAPGLEEPVVFWVPAIAISGLSIYNGDAFPAWKGHAFVGAMRNNTGQHIQRVWFNPKGEPIGREIFLAELKQRIREVKPGPDGFLYALTDETFGAVLKIEPAR